MYKKDDCMKAKMENLVNKNRTRLEEVIPLRMPYSIALDPCNLCNFKCTFCAMHATKNHQNYNKQILEFDIYKKIINDLVDMGRTLKILRLNGQGEPLLNRNFCKMVKYAKEQHVADFIETITNGSRLTPQLNEELVDSGIDRIRISIEALDEEGYYDIAKVKINFDMFVDNIRDLFEKSRGKCEIYIKIVDAALDEIKGKQKFYDIFGDICDRIFVDRVIPLWSDFEIINEGSKNVGRLSEN